MPEIEVGGAILELPDGAPPEAIQKAIEHFRTTPEFDRLVDKQRGAPARVRMLVGSATTPGGRLANLKRFYPDAVPYGDDNFVFSDPESGRPTLYNPPGFDLVGDSASVLREGSQLVGGSFGAFLGALGGPVGTAVGAGAGAAAGGATFDAVMNLTQGRVDTRGPLGVIVDTAVDFGTNAIGQRIGELVGLGLRQVIGGSRAMAQRLVDQFRRLGVRPPAGAVTGSRTVGMVEETLRRTPGAAGLMQQQTTRVLDDIAAAADDLAARFGPVRTPQGAGAVIRDAAKGAAARFTLRKDALYDEAFDLVGDATPVPLGEAAALLRTLRGELARSPRALAGAIGPAISRLEQLMDDAGDAGIEFGALRQVRSMLGRELDEPLLAQGASLQQQGLRRIYGALTADLAAAAREAGPEAAQKLATTDRYTRQFMTTAAKTMQKLADFDADEKAWRFAMSATRDGGTALARMRRHFTAEEWDVVAGSVLGRLGRATPGAQDATGEAFSVASFLTNWNKLAPEARDALFGGNRYAGIRPLLDDLVSAVGSLKGMEKLANTSNTADVLINHSFLMTSLAAIGALASGNPGVAAAFAGTTGGAYAAALLITSKPFLAWLVSPASTPAAKLARLGAIAGAQPEIREEIHQFVAALRRAPQPADTADPPGSPPVLQTQESP